MSATWTTIDCVILSQDKVNLSTHCCQRVNWIENPNGLFSEPRILSNGNYSDSGIIHKWWTVAQVIQNFFPKTKDREEACDCKRWVFNELDFWSSFNPNTHYSPQIIRFFLHISLDDFELFLLQVKHVNKVNRLLGIIQYVWQILHVLVIRPTDTNR